MAVQLAKRLGGRCGTFIDKLVRVPNPDHVVGIAGRQLSAAGKRGQRANVAGNGEFTHGFAYCNVPSPQCVIGTRGIEFRSIGGERERDDRAIMLR